MERMTYRNIGIAFVKPRVDNMDAIERLAAYEDACLTPEEVAALAKAKADGRLVVLNTAPQDEYGGLKRKYIVFKSDTGELVESCFVLRPERDFAAVIALEAYAKATENKELATDILNWVGDSGRSARLPCKVDDTFWGIERLAGDDKFFF